MFTLRALRKPLRSLREPAPCFTQRPQSFKDAKDAESNYLNL